MLNSNGFSASVKVGALESALKGNNSSFEQEVNSKQQETKAKNASLKTLFFIMIKF